MPKVLVVDDELSILQVLKTILSRNGYDVQAVDNPQDAIEILKAEDYLQPFFF